LSVILFTGIKQFFPSIPTEALKVPDSVVPSFSCCDDMCRNAWPQDCPEQAGAVGYRPWFVDYGDLNGKTWIPFMAAGPAILAFILIYLDNGITWHLINHPSGGLKHGTAYNYDLVLSGIFQAVNGSLGLPWLVATTVPCIIHLGALSTKDKDGNVLEVQETRLTHLFSHLLVALSVLALGLLKLFPMPVLYGVFLFMGLSSLPGMQFWQRVLLFCQQPLMHSPTVYNTHMKKSRVHMYTGLQLLFFGLVFVVQNVKLISIAFPLMTFLCIPARMFLFPRIFEGWELLLLDGDDLEIEAWVKAKALQDTMDIENLSDADEDDVDQFIEPKLKPSASSNDIPTQYYDVDA
jgi:uncharacterized integral membrane protein